MSHGLVIALAHHVEVGKVVPPAVDKDLLPGSDVIKGHEEDDGPLTVDARVRADVGLAVVVYVPRDIPEPLGGAAGTGGGGLITYKTDVTSISNLEKVTATDRYLVVKVVLK